MQSKIVYLIIFVLSGCSTLTPPKWVSDFYKTPISISERKRQFKNYSTEEQYELFKFGNQVVHPPAIYLAEPFAEKGAIIIPFLRDKLRVEEDEVTIRDIVLILSEVARLNLYNFSKDTEIITLLNYKVSNMQGIWKDSALKDLSLIQRDKMR